MRQYPQQQKPLELVRHLFLKYYFGLYPLSKFIKTTTFQKLLLLLSSGKQDTQEYILGSCVQILSNLGPLKNSSHFVTYHYKTEISFRIIKFLINLDDAQSPSYRMLTCVTNSFTPGLVTSPCPVWFPGYV